VGIDVDAVFGWRFAEAKAETLVEQATDVYVGDTPNDVRAGIAAGVAVVAVATGPHTADELRTAGAGLVLTSLSGFPAWLDGWMARAR
jgi:phosphoglycolate phosphatase